METGTSWRLSLHFASVFDFIPFSSLLSGEQVCCKLFCFCLFWPHVGVWDKILEPVACVRKQSEMLQLFPAYLKGEDLFGLTVSAVVRIAESVSISGEMGRQIAFLVARGVPWGGPF